MKRYSLVFIGAAMALVLGGCGGGNSNSSMPPPPVVTPPPPPPVATSLTSFVHTQLAATSETNQPVDVNGVTFSFPDDNNPAAFNDVLGTP